MTFLTILGVTKILWSSKLFLEEKTGRVIKIRVLKNVFSKQIASSDAENKTSGTSDRGGIADLPLLRTLLAIHQKSREPSFWEVMDSFVLLAHASLAASRTLLQQLLACLNFTLESEDLSFWYK